MRRSLPSLLLCGALSFVSACQQPPKPADQSEPPAQDVSEAATDHAPEADVPVLPAGEVGPMLGLRVFTDEFKLDGDLRLEIRSDEDMPALLAHVSSYQHSNLLPDGSLRAWTLDTAAVEGLIPHRVGMVVDCIGPNLRYQGRLRGYELWQDVTCNAAYLVAVIEQPESDQLREPAIWIGLAHDPDKEVLSLADSLEITIAPEPPSSFLGLYEKLDVLMAAAIATDQPPAAPKIDPVTGEPEPAPESPDSMIDVRFGRFRTGSKDTTALLMGTWMADMYSVKRALIVVDDQGRELWRAKSEELDRYGLMGITIEFVVDLDGDSQDELIVSANTPEGANQTQVWSCQGDRLTVRGEGTWWGCTTRIPMLEEIAPEDALTEEEPPVEESSEPS